MYIQCVQDQNKEHLIKMSMLYAIFVFRKFGKRKII